MLCHCLNWLDETGVPQLFMDDGASCHDSNTVVDFCAQRGIQRPYWPANSPDMNPIEHIWGWIKMRLTNLRVKPTTMAELKREIAEIWDSIELSSIQKLYESMPLRLHSLFARRGGSTKY